MLKKVLQILLVIAIVMLCYWVIIWVLGLLGIAIPHQILVCILVILGLMGAIGIISGRFDNINWWGP
jgi:uncharacterized membrane protein